MRSGHHDVVIIATREFGENALDVAALRTAVAQLAEAGREFDEALAAATALGSGALDRESDALESINQLIYLTERNLGSDEGLPRRPWFRHMIYAPGFYTGYGVKTMPAVREALEQGDLGEASRYTIVVTDAVSRMAATVREVTARLNGLR